MTVVLRSLPARQVINRIAEQHYVEPEAVRSRSRKPDIAAARVSCYVALRDEKGFSWQQIANLFGVHRSSVRSAYVRRTSKPSVCFESIQENAVELEAQLRRVTGVELVYEIGAKLGTPPWCSIFLAALVGAYPRYVSPEQLCELYFESATRLGHGNGKPVGPGIVRTFATVTRKRFRELGLPDPIDRVKPGGSRLS